MTAQEAKENFQNQLQLNVSKVMGEILSIIREKSSSDRQAYIPREISNVILFQEEKFTLVGQQVYDKLIQLGYKVYFQYDLESRKLSSDKPELVLLCKWA